MTQFDYQQPASQRLGIFPSYLDNHEDAGPYKVYLDWEAYAINHVKIKAWLMDRRYVCTIGFPMRTIVETWYDLRGHRRDRTYTISEDYVEVSFPDYIDAAMCALYWGHVGAEGKLQ
jgi:hypothetical protein